MLFFYLILAVYGSDSLTPLIDRVISHDAVLRSNASKIATTNKTQFFSTSHDAVLRSKDSKVANNKTQFSNFIELIKANPSQFIAETQQFDPEGIRNTISLLKGLKTESEAAEDRLITALNDANTALNDANADIVGANRDVEDAHLSIKTLNESKLAILKVIQQDLTTKEQELVDAEAVLESKTAVGHEKQGAKDVVQQDHDSTIPRLNEEQKVLSDVITMLEETTAHPYFLGTGVHSYNNMDIYFKLDDGAAWALVMKLSKNDFCFRSTRWTDGTAYNEEKMLDASMPSNQEYDAKSLAFHRLENVKALRFDTGRSKSVTVRFVSGATPENLMTTNDVELAEYPDWATWKAAFGSDRNRAPMFVRAGHVVTTPTPICRNSNLVISGCGQPCMFCMMAGDGAGCPTSGAHNDISSGMGNNQGGCGGGDPARCSAGGHWSGSNSVLVWARVD